MPGPSRSARGAVLGVSIAAAVVACGQSSPPVLASNFAGSGNDGPSDGGTSLTLNTDSGTTAQCVDGSVGGNVCGCLEIQLVTDQPNLYFVLDRSGSMVTDDKWTTVRNVISGVITSIGPRAKFGAAVLPDPRTDVCATGVQVMAVRLGDAPAGQVGPTALAFTEDTLFEANGGTPTAATLNNLLPTLSKLSGRTFVILATDGGPNCNANATCDIGECISNIESDPGCTPNTAPNCCTQAPEDCLDSEPTVQAVTGLASVGIETYVIGVPGSGPYGALLDRMAQAGGTARSSEPLYYDVTSADQQSLATTLASIAAKITASCTLTLQSVPPDPNEVNVYLDGQVVAADPTNGWTLSGQTITLQGSTCQRVLSGDALELRVVAGCTTVLK